MFGTVSSRAEEMNKTHIAGGTLFPEYPVSVFCIQYPSLSPSQVPRDPLRSGTCASK